MSEPAPPDAPSRQEPYMASLDAVPAAMSTLLATYSQIPADQQKAHIIEFRDRAYKSHPYPCLGRWRFLELDLSGHPLYHGDILPALMGGSEQEDEDENNWIFLDLGTCLGQDVRKLIFDGVSPARVYGADLRPEFIDIGYSLFRDEHKFPREHFIAPADVFDFSTETELSSKCDGRVGILHSCAVFHLFGLPDQKLMARRCLRLLKPWSGSGGSTNTTGHGTRKRALICGSQIGNETPGDFPRQTSGGMRYRHNTQTWREMWEGIVAEDEWRDKIQSVEVDATIVGRSLGTRDGHGDGDGDGHVDTHATGNDRLTEKQKALLGRLGRWEPGFRWMKWWVWVEFVQT